MTVRIGDTFLIPNVNKSHLLSISTRMRKSDTSCLLHPGDHKFIVRESFVDYSFSRIEHLKLITRHLESGYFVKQDPLSQEIMIKILDGADCTKRISPHIKKFLEGKT